MANSPEQPPQGSIYSNTFPELLDRLGITPAVTTYQAGKVVSLRAEQGKLNTHFRTFRRPMGLAYRSGRLAVGTMTEVWDFRNVPEVAARLEPAGRHDACFLPRGVQFTGDILVHEMAWGRKRSEEREVRRQNCGLSTRVTRACVRRAMPPTSFRAGNLPL